MRGLPIRRLCRFVAVAALLAVILFSGKCFGQTETASIYGRVTDQTGAVIPDAGVRLRNIDTNVDLTRTTNQEGFYLLPALKPGRYLMVISKQGFKTVTLKDITLDVQDNISRNFSLEIGSTSESVTVSGEAAPINTTDASVSTVVDRSFAENLPLNGRGFNALLELTPGSVITRTNYNSQGQFSVNGQRSSSNYFSVDGVSANTGVTVSTGLSQSAAGTMPATSILGGMNTLVSVDALQEFRVQTSTFAPEYGRTPGAQISIVTRSGTNQFHGDIFDYFRNDVLDANDWFANHIGLRRAALRQNDFGGVFGGPVMIPGGYNGRNRTFFFVTYEGLRLRRPQTITGNSVPSLAARQAAPTALQPYLNSFPLPTGPDQSNGFAPENATFSNPGNLDSASLRLDQSLGHTSLFVRYAHSSSFLATRGTSNSPINEITRSAIRTQSITFGATSGLGSHWTNEARFNWTYTRGSGNSALDNFGGAQPIAPALLLPPSASPANAVGAFSLSGGGTSVTVGPLANNDQRQINIVDNVSIAIAQHLIRLGVDVRRMLPVSRPVALATSATFTGVGDPTKSAAQQAVGTLLSGTVSSGSLISRNPNFGIEYLNFSSFAQDTWRPVSRLTVTYGLRWDVAPPPGGTDSNQLFALTGLENLPALAYAPAGTSLWRNSYRNLAPRLGIAYRVRDAATSGLVLRIGAGVFYDLTGGLLGTQASNPPNAATRIISRGTAYPYGAAVAIPTLPGTPPYSSAIGVDPNLKTATVYQWNAALEQEIGRDGSASITYLSSGGRHLERSVTLFNPNPTFASLLLDQSHATSSYNALQLQVKSHFRSNVQVLTSYTWSHSIDTASTDGVGQSSSGVPLTRLDPSSERGPSDFDARHSFSIALTVSSPSLRGVWWKAPLREWSTDTIFRARSSLPFEITISRDLGFGSYLFRPDVLAGVQEFVNDAQAGGGRRLDTTRPAGVPNQIGAFVVPTALRQGDLGRNATRGFGMYQADVDIRREFCMTENLRLQFKAELFNILNHPNFGDPSGLIGTFTQSTGSITLLPAFGKSPSMLGTQLGSGGVNGGLSPLYQVGGSRSTQLSLKLIF